MAVTISLSITQNSQNVTNNTSNVTVKVTVKWTYGSFNRTGECYGSITIDGTKYSFSDLKFNTSATTSGSQVIMTKNVNVKHASDGKKELSCSTSFYTGVSSGTITASAKKTLTTIPRKSSLSASNGTLGTALTLTVTRQSTSFTHTITYKCGTASGTICTKSTEASVLWNTNNGNTVALAKQNTTGTSVSVVFTITTYSGDNPIGSNTETITMSIPTSYTDNNGNTAYIRPSIDSIAVSDEMKYADKYGAYVQGRSKLKIVVAASGSQGSTIKSYKTTADGKTYTAATVTTGVINGSGTLTISVTVTDSRGRTATASTTVSVLAYKTPQVSELVAYRCKSNAVADPTGAYIAVDFDAVVTSLGDKNTAKYILEYKKQTDDEYTVEELKALSGAYVIYGASSVFDAETISSYNIRLTVTDDFTSATKTATGPSVKKVFSFLKKGLEIVGMALGKIAELEGVFDVALQTRFTGGILHPVLERDTDLDDVRTPNTYVGLNVSTYNYGNCPLTSGTFALVVVGMGDEGQVKQRLIYCHKSASRTWERIYYGETWGEWVCVSDYNGQLLWEGAFFMHGTQTITLSETVSKQRSGIVLVFSRYSNNTAQNYHFTHHFVPKMAVVMHEGCGNTFEMCGFEGDYFASKYLYLYDDTIKGNDYNDNVYTGENGIKYTNNATVLRYVIGV